MSPCPSSASTHHLSGRLRSAWGLGSGDPGRDFFKGGGGGAAEPTFAGFGVREVGELLVERFGRVLSELGGGGDVGRDE